jgi:chemosensory pili system protein ChpA (sensor histidine kinase/response regulator)
MSTHPAAQSLLWVKGELEKNLERAEKAWRAYVEGDGGEASLTETLALVREVRGVLQTIELDGGALLAHELERGLVALQSGRREPRDETLGVLTQAILQLPLYLERVVGTMRDSPHVLLPILNDLRSAAGEPVLDETELKTVARMHRRGHAARGLHGDPTLLARRLRPRYQSHLLAVYQSARDTAALGVMMEICVQIEEVVTEAVSFELWWAASAFLEALRDGGLSLTTERKQLLGRLDVALKRLSGGGTPDPDEQHLRDTLLAQVREAASAGPRVRAVQEMYRDRDRDEGWSASTADLSTPSYAALRTVGGAVHDDLRFVKTQLDIYQRMKPEERHAEELLPLVTVLRKSASTLLVLGLTALHDDLTRQAEILAEGARTPLTNEMLFEVASVLLKVEDSLDEEIERLTHARALREAGAAEPEVLLSQARASAVREVLVNLARVRNELASSSPQKGEPLPASLDAHLAASVSVLRFLGYEKAAELLERLRRIVDARVWPRIVALPQGSSLFARLADAFVSLEYWLETVRQKRPGADNLLENAEACLLALEAAYARSSPPVEITATPRETSVSTPEVSHGPPSEASASAGGGDAVREGTGEETTLSVTIEPAPSRSTPPLTPPPSAGRPPPRPVPTPESASELAVLRGEADPELLDIFREEVREVAAQAAQSVAAWRVAPNDLVSATNVRRAFHTLKGSGRLLGAERLSEFSWGLENLLNRVLDGTRPVDATLIDFVSSAVDRIAALNDELDSGQPLVPDLGAWFARTESLLRPPSAPEVPPPKPAAVQESPPEPRLAVDLYRIFRDEVSVHLATLRDWSASATESPPPPEVLRASHTISGSAHMAEVPELAVLGEAADHVLWDLSRRKSPLPAALLPVFERTLALAAEILAAYGDRRIPVPDPGPTVAEWSAAAAGLPLYRGEESVVEDIPTPVFTPLSPPASGEGEKIDRGAGASFGEATTPATGEGAASAAPSDALSGAAAHGTMGFDQELVAIFLEEGQALIDHAQQAWTDVTEHPEAREEGLRELRRDLHTLKGSARIAGFTGFGDLAHELESLLERVDPDTLADEPRGRFLRLVRDTLNALGRMLLVSRSGRVPEPPRAELDALASFTTALETASPSLPETSRAPAEEPSTPVSREGPTTAPPVAGSTGLEGGGPRDADESPAAPAAPSPEARPGRAPGRWTESSQLRISSEVLDQALNHAGEISIYRARLDEQMSTIGFNLLELRRTVDRLRDQLRRLELETEAQMLSRLPQEVSTSQTGFDPLELDRYTRVQEITRALAESVNDVASLEQLLHNLSQESETLLVQQGRVTTLIQDGLMRSRLVPIFSLEGRLRRAVQQTAAEQGKKAELVLSGTEAEIDRRLLERITAPLEHMVRNAVVHGLEPPEERRRLGKPETGAVRCEFHREGSEVLIEVRDDGRGLDYGAIRRRAETLGLLAPGQKASEEDLTAFVFRPGFSTASTLSQSAGRGIGMDIVASEIRDLAGTLDLTSRAGEGTTIRIRLPFTLAITQALLVNVRAHTFAVPLTSIEGVARLPRREYELTHDKVRPTVRYGGHDYRLEALADLMLGDARWQPPDVPSIPLLLVRGGQEFVALAVDAIQGNREIVVKPVGAQVASIAGISGATILGDGSIVLILDGAGLVRAARREAAVAAGRPEPVVQRPLALVVDDSITMRRVSQRLLERHGLEVLTAKDGVDALALLGERIPDVALVDIEMPRMDGFELTGQMRRDERLRLIPVVMITSRSGEKHREHARSVGVNAYLPKPYREEELLDTLARLVPRLAYLHTGRAS